jgi:hypothetical protein
MKSQSSIAPSNVSPVAKGCLATGLFLVVLAVYALSSAGRIDIVDGQARFDVSYNLVVQGRPVITDRWIRPFMAVPTANGDYYSFYGAPGSVFATPLVWLGLREGRPDREMSRFLFSMTSTIFGAGIALILFLLYLELGFSMRESILWTLISAFATLVWPASTSTFDNAQHAFFAIAALYLGLLSAKRDSRVLAAAAGLAAAVLVLYQEYFLIIVPALGLVTIRWKSSESADSEGRIKPQRTSRLARFFAGVREDLGALPRLLRSAAQKPGEDRNSCFRFLCFFTTAIAVAVVLSALYNDARFGSYLESGKLRLLTTRSVPMFGNPFAGFSTLLFSPGKSVFLYSPPLVLGIMGMAYLRRRVRGLAVAIILASLIVVAFISCFKFAGGDWCWGPRYLVVLLPFWALAFPYAVRDRGLRRDVVMAIVGLGLVVQILALSVENQRFFFARALPDFFWAQDPWFYFKHSALFARVGETAALNNPLPASAQVFNSIPIPDWSTYSLLGPGPAIPRSSAPEWMAHYKIYYLPRPWPLWMAAIKPALRPVNLRLWVTGVLTLGLIGLGLVYTGLRALANETGATLIALEPETGLQ